MNKPSERKIKMRLKGLLRFYKITGSNCSVDGCPKSRNKTKKDEKKVAIFMQRIKCCNDLIKGTLMQI